MQEAAGESPGDAEEGACFLADSLEGARLLQEEVQLPDYPTRPVIKLPVQGTHVVSTLAIQHAMQIRVQFSL